MWSGYLTAKRTPINHFSLFYRILSLDADPAHLLHLETELTFTSCVYVWQMFMAHIISCWRSRCLVGCIFKQEKCWFEVFEVLMLQNEYGALLDSWSFNTAAPIGSHQTLPNFLTVAWCTFEERTISPHSLQNHAQLNKHRVLVWHDQLVYMLLKARYAASEVFLCRRSVFFSSAC